MSVETKLSLFRIYKTYIRIGRSNTGINGQRVVVFEAVLMHNPISFLAMRSTATIEDEGFTHADLGVGVADALVAAGGLPEACSGGAVGA